jgi:hypothetical protein
MASRTCAASSPIWTAASRRNRPKGEQGTVTPSAPASLAWRIEISDDAEIEALWCMVRRAENPAARLSMFLYGEAATSHEGDRGEIMQEAAITSYRLILDHGDFPDP